MQDNTEKNFDNNEEKNLNSKEVNSSAQGDANDSGENDYMSEEEKRRNESVSERLEKAELEKKYFNQKTEIRKKISEAEKALNNSISEAKEDYEKVLKEEPNLLSEEDKAGYQKYLEDTQKELKTEIETLQAHENELELNYDDLKTEPKSDIFIEYAKRINHAVGINAPLMKMVFDYFNFLNDNQKNQEKAKIKIDCFLDDSGLFMDSFPHNTNMDYYVGSVMIDFLKDKPNSRIIITLKKYFEQNRGFVFKLCFFSEKKTYLNPDYVSKKILFNAIAHSRIKGTYITMAPGSIMWHQENLERRAFSDIYLPKSIMEDLELYTTLHDKTGKLLRYLMIGNPGTGKTESTLAIANYLKDRKVTVIKTQVCEALKEKVELAELLAPAIIIFDDIDLSLGSRKKGMISPGLSQFLDVLDGTEKIRKDVGIIATTNSLELLDMAAQRPGRFDKMLSFDSLTKDNIKNIILKSLKYNFALEVNSKEVAPFVTQLVIDKFFNSGVTGSHVFNTTKMLYLRIQTLELEHITPEWVVKEITNELNTLARIRRTDYLSDKMSGNSSGEVGFNIQQNIDEEEEIYSEDEEATQPLSSISFQADEQGVGSKYRAREGDDPRNYNKSDYPQTESEGPSESSL